MRPARRSKNLGREKAMRQQEALVRAFDRKHNKQTTQRLPQMVITSSTEASVKANLKARENFTARCKANFDSPYREYRTAEEIKADSDACIQGVLVSYK